MRLIGREKLCQLKGKGEGVEKWAKSWVAEVLDARWHQPADVIEQFPNADHQAQDHFLFPIGDCQFAIRLQIAFAQGIALISDLNRTK